MKYFCLSLLALALSFTAFAISPITGTTKICQGSTSLLKNSTPGGSWSSGAPLIASVGTTGIVNGLYPGTAIITYTSGSSKATTTVTVNGTAPIIGTTTACVGSSTILSDALYGGTWSSKDPSIATVTPGISNVSVTGVSAGLDSIFYTYPSGCQSFTIVTIKPLPTPILGSLNLCLGDVTILSDATSNGVWSSGTPGVATIGIASGVVTGVAAGTTIISYTGLSGCVRTAVLTVNPLPAPITGVKHAFQGYETTLSDVTPGGTWSVNFPSIATIGSTSGLVHAVSSGVATVFYKLTSTGCSISTHYVVNGFPDSASIFPISAWYPFCGDIKDHKNVPPPNDLVTVPLFPYSVPVAAPDRFGMNNMAYHFAGTTDPIVHTGDLLRRPAFSSFTPGGDFAYSCWVKFDTNVLQSGIIMYNGIVGLNGLGFMINDGSSVVSNPGRLVSVYIAGWGAFTNVFPYDATYGPAAVNGWVHLYLEKVTTPFSSNIDFYVNNIFVGTIDQNSYPFTPPTTTFQIGMDQSSSAFQFSGDIDDAAMFNTSLTKEQRTSLHMFNPDPPVYTLGNDTTICADVITLYTTPTIQGRIYTWSTGDTLHDTVLVVPAAFSTTSYSLTISQPYGCNSVDAINVTKTPLIVNIGVDTTICTGDTITLRAKPSYGPTATYIWSNGATSDTIRVPSTGSYMVTVDSSVCRGHDTAYVAAQVTPIVDLGPDIFNCQGLPATINNVYKDYDKTFTYIWSNGSNLDSLVTNTSGNFWVQITNNGCSKADSIKVTIVTDTFSFFSKDTAICLGRFVTGLATFNPIVSYQWTPTTGVPLSTLPSTNITPDTSATYFLTGSYPGCPDIVYSFHIDVQPNPKVFLGGNRHVCQFDSINIRSKVTPNWYDKYMYSWSPGKFLDDSTRSAIIFTAGDTTDIKLTVTTSAGCIGTDSALILVHPGNFDSAFADISVCPGDIVRLIPNMYYQSALDGVTATYLWQPGKYVSDSTDSTPILQAVTSEKFRAIGTSQFGCRDTFTFNVIVNPGPVLYLGDSVVLHPGEKHQINSQTNCSYFRWFPPTGVSDTTISNPLLAPSVSTHYIIHASTEEGCSLVDSFDVRVDPSTLIDLPNAFTPGQGSNSKFYILKKGIATISYFRIYNRYGSKVFETSNIDQGWDGTFNGQPQPFSVYVYEVEGVANDGTKFHKQGNVTLIR